jgi:hypothetical protein
MRLPPGRARAFETAGKQGCDCVAWSRKRRTGFASRQGVYESPRPLSHAGLRDKMDVLTKWLTKVKCSGIVYLARAPYNERSRRMNTIQELQKLREELIREIDEKFDWIIDEVKKESVPSRQKESRKPRNYEIIYPLNVGAGIFKGKRPTGVIFADGRRTENPTWKSVAEELLKDCCKDSDQRQALMDLRGKVLGRNRVLLGSETGKMRSPVKIDEALYIETHYDAETLMRILTTRILDMVGYDYSKIRIAVKAV